MSTSEYTAKGDPETTFTPYRGAEDTPMVTIKHGAGHYNVPLSALIEFVRSVEGQGEQQDDHWACEMCHDKQPLSRRTKVLAMMAATIYAANFSIKDTVEIARQLLAAVETEGDK